MSIIPVWSSHCVWEKIKQAIYPPVGQKQGQRDPSGHQQRMKTECQAMQTCSQNTLLSKSGCQGLVLSIFVLSGFWQPWWEARGLYYPEWDINKPLMRGNGPRYTMGRSLWLGSVWTMKVQIFQLCSTQHAFIERSPQYCTAGMLHFINDS